MFCLMSNSNTSRCFMEMILLFLLALQLNSSFQAIFLNIYRPKYCTYFFDGFAELLSLNCSDLDNLLIVGDFTICVDKPEYRGT